MLLATWDLAGEAEVLPLGSWRGGVNLFHCELVAEEPGLLRFVGDKAIALCLLQGLAAWHPSRDGADVRLRHCSPVQGFSLLAGLGLLLELPGRRRQALSDLLHAHLLFLLVWRLVLFGRELAVEPEVSRRPLLGLIGKGLLFAALLNAEHDQRAAIAIQRRLVLACFLREERSRLKYLVNFN